MITPLEIQSKNFKKSIFGYKSQEVENYLSTINEDYERMYRENIELKDRVSLLNDQINQYNNLQETLKDTLVLAQSTADEVTSSARKKAELIIEDAELNAKDRTNKAAEEVVLIKNEYDKLAQEIQVFKTRYESFMKAQLLSLEEFNKSFIEFENANNKSFDKSEA